MSSRSHQDEPPSLTGFAAALGEHLPGRWQAGEPTSLLAQEAGSHRIWHSGPLAYAAFDAANVQRCVLTSPYGLQLYVLPRPHRADQLLVLPMLPAGCQQEHVKGLPHPHGIAVPANPVRAAAAVRRRMLLEYRFASLPALRAASPGHLQVQVTFDTERRPRIRTTYIRALTELLARDGFLLDAATGECHLPDILTEAQTRRQLIKSLERLRHLGFHVSVRSSLALGAPSTEPVPRANLPKGPSR
ncbi:hypothetical protein PV416_07965 [Streptomyces ipomoeae]|uniref:hypothetical protein n=1 Tax=Streptomyces ipomoeae TaxID=103232 RepID=UPI0029A4022A|nr:hypothetical protein [Streptomyces ipomoeae]MDX2821026.1 hypothetical protein [Streptomyces ipomoeae]MDX2874459.1 hypothetical protein [Streptomyces ipomoeae]